MRQRALHENILIRLDQRHHGVPFQQGGCALGHDARWIDDGCEPEPELQHYARHLAHVTEEDVEYTEDNTQAYGKYDLDQQDRQYGNDHPAGKVAGDQQEAQKQAEDDGEIEQRIQHDHQRQTDPRKAELLKNIGVGQKNVDQTVEHFREQPPS